MSATQKKKNKILTVGIVGGIVTAICCFTPLLVFLLSALGLAAIIVYLDYVLFPLLFVFLVMIGYGFYLHLSRKD